jgi:hypothetical protein
VTIKHPPLKISIMLACHFAADPASFIGERTWNSPRGEIFRAQLRAARLITSDHRSTTLGDQWVDTICKTPLPTS